MTDEMMALQGLLEETSDADLVREMLGFAAARLPPGSPDPGCFAAGLGGAAARRGRTRPVDTLMQSAHSPHSRATPEISPRRWWLATSALSHSNQAIGNDEEHLELKPSRTKVADDY